MVEKIEITLELNEGVPEFIIMGERYITILKLKDEDLDKLLKGIKEIKKLQNKIKVENNCFIEEEV